MNWCGQITVRSFVLFLASSLIFESDLWSVEDGQASARHHVCASSIDQQQATIMQLKSSIDLLAMELELLKDRIKDVQDERSAVVQVSLVHVPVR